MNFLPTYHLVDFSVLSLPFIHFSDISTFSSPFCHFSSSFPAPTSFYFNSLSSSCLTPTFPFHPNPLFSASFFGFTFLFFFHSQFLPCHVPLISPFTLPLCPYHHITSLFVFPFLLHFTFHHSQLPFHEPNQSIYQITPFVIILFYLSHKLFFTLSFHILALVSFLHPHKALPFLLSSSSLLLLSSNSLFLCFPLPTSLS